jgi:glycine/D-amino acid oxidase-like deaminating enzyme
MVAAPRTAKAVAALLAGAPPGLKLEPFRPSRFA